MKLLYGEAQIPEWLSDPLVGKSFSLLVAFLIIFSAFGLIKKRFISKIQDNTKRYHFRKFANFSSYVLFGLFGISIFSDRLAGLAIFFGVAGAGIAFALQEVIASIAGWFAITFGGFFRTSDRVQLGGIRGDVIDIGIFRTTLMECGGWVNGDLYNGRIVRIANSFVFKEPVFNYSADFEFLWDEIVLPVRPGTDISTVIKVLTGAADEVVGEYSRRATNSWKNVVHKYRIEDAQVTPLITASVLMDRINFTVRYIVDYKQRRITQHALTKLIVERFATHTPPISLAATVIEIDRVAQITLSPRNT